MSIICLKSRRLSRRSLKKRASSEDFSMVDITDIMDIMDITKITEEDLRAAEINVKEEGTTGLIGNVGDCLTCSAANLKITLNLLMKTAN
jgi:hypothetical protein